MSIAVVPDLQAIGDAAIGLWRVARFPKVGRNLARTSSPAGGSDHPSGRSASRAPALPSALGMDQMVLLASEGQVVCEHCEVADRFWTRAVGLLGRTRLPRGQGLLIKPTWSIHTWFMRFPIDVVFLDRELYVLKMRKHMRPWRATARFRADSALELAAGECDRLRLGVGDRLAWDRLTRVMTDPRSTSVGYAAEVPEKERAQRPIDGSVGSWARRRRRSASVFAAESDCHIATIQPGALRQSRAVA